MFHFDVMQRVLELDIGVAKPDNRRMFELLGAIHPLTLAAYPSDGEHNGWVTPQAGQALVATIKRNGETLFDGTVHPLAVIGASTSFRGVLSKAELDKHVFHSERFPDAYVFHSMNNYRPWARDWGFCVPYNLWKTWPDGDYAVDLQMRYVPQDMLVGKCRVAGGSPQTVVFNAHTCHPCQANDGLVGVVVLLELFKWLASRKTRFSYLGVFAPEHLGTVFDIAAMPAEELAQIRLGCFVEMVGSRTPYALQRTFAGDTRFDALVEYVLRDVQPDLHVGPFRTVVGNDETVWEAPGIEVPMVSVSRWPYPEYHTSADDLSIIAEQSMAQTLDVLKRIVRILEDDCVMIRKFTGLVALSNPKYDLYVQRLDPVVDKGLSDLDLKFGLLQDYLPRFFDGNHSVFEIARRFDVPFEILREHIGRFEAEGLVELRPVADLDFYRAAGKR